MLLAGKLFLLCNLIARLIASTKVNTKEICFHNSIRNSSSVNALNDDWIILKRSFHTFKRFNSNLCNLQHLRKFDDSHQKLLEEFKVIPLFEIDIAVLYHCVQSENSTNIEDLFILSRDKKLKSDAVQTAEMLLRNLEIRIPTVTIDQSECREQRRREKIAKRGSIRQLIEVPNQDYIAKVMFELCLALAQNIFGVFYCMHQYHSGQFHINLDQ